MIMLNKKNALSLSQPSHDNTLDIDTIYIEYTNSFIQMYIYIQTKKKEEKNQTSYTLVTPEMLT